MLVEVEPDAFEESAGFEKAAGFEETVVWAQASAASVQVPTINLTYDSEVTALDNQFSY
jgi:hypothetical protein